MIACHLEKLLHMGGNVNEKYFYLYWQYANACGAHFFGGHLEIDSFVVSLRTFTCYKDGTKKMFSQLFICSS